MDSGDMAVNAASKSDPGQGLPFPSGRPASEASTAGVSSYWMGEMEVARERAAEDLEYRRGRDEAWDARKDEPRVLYNDAAGREW